MRLSGRGVCRLVWALALLASSWAHAGEPGETELAVARGELARDIGRGLDRSLLALGRDPADPRLLEAIAATPRHHFVPPPLVPFAYLDRPLPIGHGQTVSQPSLVALMLALAAPKLTDRVLLVGIGGGYDTALLARLAGEVYCVELQPEVAHWARERLDRLGHTAVRIRRGDGYYGWSEVAPFAAIVLRQSLGHPPPPLLKQLAPGGRLIMPLGPADAEQHLTLFEKQADGRLKETRALAVRFVAMPGGDRI
ncbi:MAG: protein-L-isoaspartate O-methyltransferase [Alphaproteobacteria bacterium]|nr:protein-L-isoaspartate O-methyltransferase [Alphaproteobacteria bacterium]